MIMNQKKLTGGAVLILCFLFFYLSLSWGETEENERAPVADTTRRMVCKPAENLKALLNQAKAHFFAPNLEGEGGATKEKMMEGGAPEDKLREAVAESMGKTKATVEDSAKSAAKLATETIQQTKEKVTRSFSPQNDHEDEL